MLTDEQTFKIVYLTPEADAANPVHDSFTLTMNITGVTRAQEFTSSSTYNFEIRDANTVADISQSSGGQVVYVLPAQGVANSISTGTGADTVHAGTGNDIVSAGAGNDFINVGGGTNIIDGGAGTDKVSYAGLATDVTVNLVTGGATGGAIDTLTASQVTDIADNGTSSSLTFILDTGDTFTADVSGTDYIQAVTAGVTTTYGAGVDVVSAGVDTTYANYNSANALQATVNVDYRARSGGRAAGQPWGEALSALLAAADVPFLMLFLLIVA